MSEYISEFTGLEIDERLKMAETAYTQAAENTEQLSTKPGMKNPDIESSEIFNDYKDNVASGYYAHAEGRKTTASGHRAHSEGTNTTASGDSSHAEGFGTVASGYYSHAEGRYTHATATAQHVGGKYNIVDEEKKYAEIIGNGDENSASNARTLDWEGNAWHAGDVQSTDPETSETISLNSTAALVNAVKNEVDRNTDELAEYALSNEDAHYDLGLRVTAAEEAITALGTDVSGKLTRYRKWMEGSISVDIGSATLIEISGVSTVGIAHRHYLKLVRVGTETAVLEESKGAGTGVSYTYSIEDNILTVTNTGSYGHNITVIY